LDHERREMSEKRETANAAMYPAIPCLTGNIASGTVEETRSFAQKNSRCEFFCAKEKTYHAAAGETGFHRVNARFARSPRNACHFKDTFTG
jgi:hypothetical protein